MHRRLLILCALQLIVTQWQHWVIGEICSVVKHFSLSTLLFCSLCILRRGKWVLENSAAIRVCSSVFQLFWMGRGHAEINAGQHLLFVLEWFIYLARLHQGGGMQIWIPAVILTLFPCKAIVPKEIARLLWNLAVVLELQCGALKSHSAGRSFLICGCWSFCLVCLLFCKQLVQKIPVVLFGFGLMQASPSVFLVFC